MGTKSTETNNGGSGIVTIKHFALIPHRHETIPWTEVSRVMSTKMQSDFVVYMWNNKITRKKEGVYKYNVEEFLKDYYG